MDIVSNILSYVTPSSPSEASYFDDNRFSEGEMKKGFNDADPDKRADAL